MDRGYSTHSRHLMNESLEKQDQPVLTQLKKAYWTTKQQIIKTIGKKEDEHVQASDAELDAKLELFTQIKISCIDLLKVIIAYQKRLVVLAREENNMGKFLRSQSEEDTTQAGKIMSAVGKSQAFSAQQRIQLRQPLYRLFQEVETFRNQAIVDTQITVGRMEEARTEYRGALLWMKDVSERLDPDAYNRLEKFRKVQAQVRKAKDAFDKQKLNVLQKVDLLAASRSNMFSHALATYQNSLLSFFKKTSKTMNAVSETFKGFQYYEFTMLKNDLDETTKELARETASERTAELLDSLLQDTGKNPKTEEDKLIYDIIMSLQDRQQATEKAFSRTSSSNNKTEGDAAADKKSAAQQPKKKQSESNSRPVQTGAAPASPDSTTGTGSDAESESHDEEDASIEQQFGEFQAAMDKETREFNLLGQPSGADKYSALRETDDDLLNDIFGPEQTSVDSNMSDLSLSSDGTGAGGSNTTLTSGFLPADLLDSSDLSGLQLQGNAPTQEHQQAQSSSASQQLMNLFSMGNNRPQPPAYTPPHTSASAGSLTGTSDMQNTMSSASKTSQGQSMSSWYNLFADLDPLADPDSIGKTKPASADDGCA